MPTDPWLRPEVPGVPNHRHVPPRFEQRDRKNLARHSEIRKFRRLHPMESPPANLNSSDPCFLGAPESLPPVEARLLRPYLARKEQYSSHAPRLSRRLRFSTGC